MDLASPTQFKEWITFFDQQNCPSFGVNSHNKDNVKEVWLTPSFLSSLMINSSSILFIYLRICSAFRSYFLDCIMIIIFIPLCCFSQFLKFLQAHVRNLRKSDYDASSDTVTVMLLGIPNVGKSALANSLHQIGRITAAGISVFS